MTERIAIDGDDWRCLCGNTPHTDGFYPCDSAGNRVEPVPEAWGGLLYVCERCDRIVNQETREVVGHA